MKRAFLAVLLLGLGLALAGCQSFGVGGGSGGGGEAGGGGGPADPTLSRILESGTLRVGLTADLPPLSLRDSRGEIVGFEVDVVRALAGAMGLELELVVKPFSELLPALEAGQVDLVAAGLTITPERNARVAFAGPYLVSGASAVGASPDIGDMRDPRAFDRAGVTLTALADSTSARFVADELTQAKLVTVASYEEAEQMVAKGSADAMVADHLACKMAMWRSKDVELTAMPYPFTVEPLGIALPAGAPLFLNLVENYLNTLENTGLLARYKARWLADASWMTELQ